MRDNSAQLAQGHRVARTRQVDMPYTWVYKYSSMIADHLSTCGGLKRPAIIADGSACLTPGHMLQRTRRRAAAHSALHIPEHDAPRHRCST